MASNFMPSPALIEDRKSLLKKRERSWNAYFRKYEQLGKLQNSDESSDSSDEDDLGDEFEQSCSDSGEDSATELSKESSDNSSDDNSPNDNLTNDNLTEHKNPDDNSPENPNTDNSPSKDEPFLDEKFSHKDIQSSPVAEVNQTLKNPENLLEVFHQSFESGLVDSDLVLEPGKVVRQTVPVPAYDDVEASSVLSFESGFVVPRHTEAKSSTNLIEKVKNENLRFESEFVSSGFVLEPVTLQRSSSCEVVPVQDSFDDEVNSVLSLESGFVVKSHICTNLVEVEVNSENPLNLSFKPEFVSRPPDTREYYFEDDQDEITSVSSFESGFVTGFHSTSKSAKTLYRTQVCSRCSAEMKVPQGTFNPGGKVTFKIESDSYCGRCMIQLSGHQDCYVPNCRVCVSVADKINNLMQSDVYKFPLDQIDSKEPAQKKRKRYYSGGRKRRRRSTQDRVSSIKLENEVETNPTSSTVGNRRAPRLLTNSKLQGPDSDCQEILIQIPRDRKPKKKASENITIHYGSQLRRSIRIIASQSLKTETEARKCSNSSALVSPDLGMNLKTCQIKSTPKRVGRPSKVVASNSRRKFRSSGTNVEQTSQEDQVTSSQQNLKDRTTIMSSDEESCKKFRANRGIQSSRKRGIKFLPRKASAKSSRKNVCQSTPRSKSRDQGTKIHSKSLERDVANSKKEQTIQSPPSTVAQPLWTDSATDPNHDRALTWSKPKGRSSRSLISCASSMEIRSSKKNHEKSNVNCSTTDIYTGTNAAKYPAQNVSNRLTISNVQIPAKKSVLEKLPRDNRKLQHPAKINSSFTLNEEPPNKINLHQTSSQNLGERICEEISTPNKSYQIASNKNPIIRSPNLKTSHRAETRNKGQEASDVSLQSASGIQPCENPGDLIVVHMRPSEVVKLRKRRFVLSRQNV